MKHQGKGVSPPDGAGIHFPFEDESSDTFEGDVFFPSKALPFATTPRTDGSSVKQRKSLSSSMASVGSLLTRVEQQPHPQPTTEGRLKLKTTIDCGSDILCCKWSGEGTTLGVCLRSGEIRFYTPNGQLFLTLPPPEWKANLPETNPRAREISKASPYDSESMKLIHEHLMKTYLHHPAATSLVWHVDRPNVITSTYSDGQIFTWEIPDTGLAPKKPLASIKGAGIDVKCVPNPSALDRSFITFTANKVLIRDLVSLSPILEFKSPRLTGCPLEDAGRIWAVGGRGKDIIGGGYNLVWWETKTGEVRKEVGAVRVRGQGLAVNPSANRMVTGTYGGGADSVRIWEVSSGRVTHTLFSESYQTTVKSATWVGRDVLVMGGADPHLIRLVNLDNTTIGGIKGLRHGVTFLDSFIGRANQTSKLAAASGNFVYVIDLPK